MGGTTAKICLVRGHTPKTARVFEVARTYRFKKGSGMPISIPVIEMIEIGAGGGSLASVDALKQIRVGPDSAGSEPGPACYQRGGTRPAVTDADLVLGRIDPAAFAGGAIALSVEAARKALASDVGAPLGLDASGAAFGVSEVVDENMANAARVHAVENGEDLARYAMIAFGGAAPLHAARLCEKLGIDRFIVPPRAGVGSAVGFLRAPFSFEATRSLYMRLSEFSAPQAGDVIAQLRAEASAFGAACGVTGPMREEIKAYLRYIGQGWEIPVELDREAAGGLSVGNVRAAFEAAYGGLFGRTVEGLDIEIASWSVDVRSEVPPAGQVDQFDPAGTSPAETAEATAQLFDARSGAYRSAPVFARDAIATGQRVNGPAVIVEAETSIKRSDFGAL